MIDAFTLKGPKNSPLSEFSQPKRFNAFMRMIDGFLNLLVDPQRKQMPVSIENAPPDVTFLQPGSVLQRLYIVFTLNSARLYLLAV